MPGWEQIAEELFRRRYDPLDVSVCVVRAPEGLLVVDTRASHREADELLRDLRQLSDAPVRWVVNTHAHYDHTFGNARFSPPATVLGHERVPAHLAAYEVPMLAAWTAGARQPREEWAEVVITPPTELVGERRVLEVGGREVQLLHLGRGHTDNDLVVHLPDAGAWLVGDLVEESGPPMYGSGSFPLDWPGTLDRLGELLGDGAVIVPGHGAVVDAAYARAQREQLAEAAALIRELHAAGVAEQDALAAGSGRWPFPDEAVGPAVRDGYAQLRASGSA
ncbi:MBL fold metallo-hydrolase [Motilibacter aurantiacus]|uniref:MBL fold metallo-hydrolase n=1 Tax=Motilibacter aurantiacus TaxID=2714955 RepID=UPI00140B5533|nr:MBL fold metallo-hydrolase [Motilibacter aurantiacus]